MGIPPYHQYLLSVYLLFGLPDEPPSPFSRWYKPKIRAKMRHTENNPIKSFDIRQLHKDRSVNHRVLHRG